jgi:DNA primase
MLKDLKNGLILFDQHLTIIGKDEPRIIIPLFYQNTLVGFQGRSLGLNKVKYITIMLTDDAPKIYGLDEIKKDATVYITEGPFDSIFISNCYCALWC